MKKGFSGYLITEKKMRENARKILLSRNEERFFSYTDRKDTYIMLNVSHAEKNDGLVIGNDTVFTDFYLEGKDKNIYLRTAASFTELYPDHFVIYFDSINVRVICTLPEKQSSLLIKIEDHEKHLKKIVFVNKQEKTAQVVIKKKELALLYTRDGIASVKKSLYKDYETKSQEYEKNLEEHFDAETGSDLYTKALFWAKVSGHMLCTGEEDDRGVWAGLPWFRDNWGRDTFIALPGLLLVNGYFEEARQILLAFASHQNTDKSSVEYGRIPNRYKKGCETIYNTADGNLWFIKTLWQYLQYTGDKDFLVEIWNSARTAVLSDLELRCDENGFLINKDSDTWMDARIEGKEPLSPRGNRANDIQSLWFEVLQIYINMSLMLEEEDHLKEVTETAAKLKKNFESFFWDKKKGLIADRIDEDGTCDFSIRPNQLFCINASPSLLSRNIHQKVTEECISKLCLPYGVASLSPEEQDFHPYHDGCDKYHKDAAYHNGALWLWLCGPMVTALCDDDQQDKAFELTDNLCHQIFETGCAGTLSENADAALNKEGSLVPSGTWSQAWSVSEFTRNFYQDYLGIRPNILDESIMFSPHLPSSLGEGKCRIYVGDSWMEVSWSPSETENRRKFIFKTAENFMDNICLKYVTEGEFRSVDLSPSKEIEVNVRINIQDKKLQFASLKDLDSYNCLKEKDYLFTKMRREYKNKKIWEVR